MCGTTVMFMQGAPAMHKLNRFACKECLRRKIKCTRENPRCGVCVRAQRTCFYEEVYKTPLTRKHLTQVEEELALTKALLAQLHPDMDQAQALAQLGHTDTESVRKRPRPASPQPSLFASPKTAMTVLLLLELGPDMDFRTRQFLPPAPGSIARFFPQKQTGIASAPFAAISRPFEWDERKLLRHDTRPTIIDGMATTVSNSYLGVTLSAALLHLVGVGYFLHPIPPGLLALAISTNVERTVLERNVNGYFETFHLAFPIVHKALFFAYFNEIVPPPQCWLSLLYIVAAIGSFMLATSANDHDDLVFFDRAKQNLSIEDWETGNLTLVQSLSLMSSYLQLRDRPNSGYNYLGMAVRMAMGLGIHKNIEDASIPLFDQEIRRRVWWCLYVFDCGQTITYGRPLGISDSGVDAKLPLNVLDSSLTSASVNTPDEENVPTFYTSVRLQALFHLLTNGIYEQVISDPFPAALSLLQWDAVYITRWKLLVPHFYREDALLAVPFRLSHAMIHWRCSNFRIIMFRMFVLKNEDKSDGEAESRWRASSLCLEECRATIRSMQRFWGDERAYNRMDAWYSLYFLVPAVMMPLVCLRNQPDSLEAPFWREDVVVAQQVIRKIMAICPPASRILDLINKVSPGCVSDVVENHSAIFPIPNLAGEEGPIPQLMQLHSMLWPDLVGDL